MSGCRNVVVQGGRVGGRGRRTLMETINDDMKKCGLNRGITGDREVWRKAIHGKTSNLRKRGKTDDKR